jgi:hypothetical protein
MGSSRFPRFSMGPREIVSRCLRSLRRKGHGRVGHHSSDQSLNPPHFCIPPLLYSKSYKFRSTRRPSRSLINAPYLDGGTRCCREGRCFCFGAGQNSSISRRESGRRGDKYRVRERKAWREKLRSACLEQFLRCPGRREKTGSWGI